MRHVVTGKGENFSWLELMLSPFNPQYSFNYTLDLIRGGKKLGGVDI